MPEDHELERLLRAEGRPRPGERFRASCRERFLASAPSREDSGGPEETPSQGEPPHRSPAEMGDPLESLLRSRPLPRPRPELIAACRERFLADAGPHAPDADPAASEAVLRPLAGAASDDDAGFDDPGELDDAPDRAPFVRVAAVLAAIAAALLITFALPRQPTWRVVDVVGQGGVEVAGTHLAEHDYERLAHEVGLGGSLLSGDCCVELELRPGVRLSIRPGTAVSFAELGQVLSDGELRIQLARGEVLLRVHPGGEAPALAVATEDGLVRVTGTVLGVLSRDEGTCICVEEGSVSVHVPGAADEVVGPRASLFLHRGAGQPETRFRFDGPEAEAHAGHLASLFAFRDRT